MDSQIQENELKFSITANRTTWRIDSLLKTKNIDYRIQERDYEKILFTKDEAEEFYLKSIDSLETDVFKFYEFSFKYRCSYEDDEATNLMIEQERAYWKRGASTIKWGDTIIQLTDSVLQEVFPECECCTVRDGMVRSGYVFEIPQCVGRIGLVVIDKKVWRNIYFVSGKCIFLSTNFFQAFFQEKNINDLREVEKYIHLRFWEDFSTSKYILKKIDKINKQKINFMIENKEDSKVFKYSLNLKTGEMVMLSKSWSKK